MSVREVSAREFLGAKFVIASATVFPQLLKPREKLQAKVGQAVTSPDDDAKPESEKP